ncbi:MAG: hypothetical protein ACO3K7_01630 [Candidatus Marinamargulisbacteria bacterium]
MMVRVLLLIIISVPIWATSFQLSTVVDNQQLVPVIKINGQPVITITEVGARQSFLSTFDRSEKIFNTLNELNKKQSNLNRIRIRRGRNKTDYVAYIDNIEVYRVTPNDVIGTDLSVYQMAARWRDNINKALALSSLPAPSDSEVDSTPGFLGDSSPLIGFLSIFSNSHIFVMLLQFSLFIFIQILAIALTFNYLNRRNKHVYDEFQKRLKKFHRNQIQQKNLMASLSHQLDELNTKVGGNDTKNISNI